MADKVPIRAGLSGASLTGLAIFASGETIGVAHGGTGLATIGSNQLVTGNGTSAITSESNLTFDGTILKATGDLCATVKVVSPALCIGSEYVLPTADGSAGQLMCTDGSGALAFATAAAGFVSTDAHTWTADQTFNDNVKVTLGTGGDADFYYDGTQVILSPAVAGSGGFLIGATANSTDQSGYTPLLVGKTSMLLGTTSGSSNTETILTENTYLSGGGWKHINTDEASYIYQNSGSIQFYTSPSAAADASFGGAERMRITSAGNVGIGTTAPAAILDVNGQKTDDTFIAEFVNTQTSDVAVQKGVKIRAGIDLYDQAFIVTRGSDDGEMFKVDGAGTIFICNDMIVKGDVGIGTTAPEAPLDIIGPAQGTVTTYGSEVPGLIINQQSATNEPGPLLEFRTYNTIDYWTQGYIAGVDMYANAGNISYAGGLAFFTQPGGSSDPAGQRSKGASLIERMRIDSSGSVGINNNDPSGTGSVQACTLVLGNTSLSSGSHTGMTMMAGTAGISRLDMGDTALSSAGGFYYLHSEDSMNFVTGGTWNGCLGSNGNLCITGAMSKASGSFTIDHPLESKKDTHHLAHSFIEGPQADLIYRGVTQLADGSAEINVDTVSGMTEGTFVVLNRCTQVFTTNESNWDAVRGSITGNILTIESNIATSAACISWMVVGERQDQHMFDTDWTDEDGRVIVEFVKPERPEEG